MTSLDGLRILDFSRAMAGPYCTMMLGDLGADVIKVERPGGGDDSRGWGPPFADNRQEQSAYFISANRNKRSLVLDLKSEQGLKVAQHLIDQSDVLVENFRTGVMERLGLGYQQVHAQNQRLIYCSISGYGRTGPDADMPGYDVVAQAEGGLMSITGPQQGPPSRTGIPIVDITAGMFAATAILAALRARQASGQGQRIDVSLLDTVTALLTNVASNYLVGGQPPERWGNDHPNLAPYGAYQAEDGWLVIGVANQRQWERFCQAVDRPDLVQDERFATNDARVTHRRQLNQVLTKIFASQPTERWLSALRQADVPSGPINGIPEVFNYPQKENRVSILEIDQPQVGSIRTPGFPYQLSENPAELQRPPPRLGEHTEEILIKLLGFSKQEAARFVSEQAGDTV